MRGTQFVENIVVCEVARHLKVSRFLCKNGFLKYGSYISIVERIQDSFVVSFGGM